MNNVCCYLTPIVECVQRYCKRMNCGNDLHRRRPQLLICTRSSNYGGIWLSTTHVPVAAMSKKARIENTFAFIGNLFLDVKLIVN